MRSRTTFASVGDPFKQFHGVGFEQGSLAELSPLVSGVILIAHISLIAGHAGKA
jgi:hypothetical protein